jgi:isocitrate/isopropylmalate dehydrogenase
MAHRVTLIPGDGTGPEIAEATRRVLEATGVELEWDIQQAGADVMDQHGGNPLPDEVLDSIKQNGVALKGPITTPVGTGFRSVNVALRKTLDLYGQVRPCKSYPGVRSRYEDVDLVVVRENTEDLYAGIEFEDRIVDNLSMQLVQRPEEYDVLVCPNLYGDIVSDLCAGLIGGLGLAPGGNFGTHAAVFEPTHGSAPKYTGQNRVNPMAMMLSGVMMLRHLEERDAADRLETAIAAVIAEGRSVTYDMKPARDDPTAVGTSEVADAVIDRMGVRV